MAAGFGAPKGVIHIIFERCLWVSLWTTQYLAKRQSDLTLGLSNKPAHDRQLPQSN